MQRPVALGAIAILAGAILGGVGCYEFRHVFNRPSLFKVLDELTTNSDLMDREKVMQTIDHDYDIKLQILNENQQSHDIWFSYGDSGRSLKVTYKIQPETAMLSIEDLSACFSLEEISEVMNLKEKPKLSKLVLDDGFDANPNPNRKAGFAITFEPSTFRKNKIDRSAMMNGNDCIEDVTYFETVQ